MPNTHPNIDRRRFRITRGKGFYFGFENGYGLSVQFGPGNYSQNYDADIGTEDVECGQRGSNTAEIAIIDCNGNLVDLPHGDSVDGYLGPEKVLTYLLAAHSGDPLKYLTDHPVRDAA